MQDAHYFISIGALSQDEANCLARSGLKLHVSRRDLEPFDAATDEADTDAMETPICTTMQQLRSSISEILEGARTQADDERRVGDESEEDLNDR